MGRDPDTVRHLCRCLEDFVRALGEEPETVIRALRMTASRIEAEDREKREVAAHREQ